MADYTFRDMTSKCQYRMTCPGYVAGLCFNENHLENDEWCNLHKAERENPRMGIGRIKYTSYKKERG